ncbi:MAG: 3-phosphoshikimate 1-carboxyvinyltransferase [Candidatus Levybacteria bacterium]|nr:3-phosphoshikimate 1-carboxyvinyltransferase [Candidatus Levybacteria bacterium]
MNIIKIFPLKSSINAEIGIPGSKSYTNRALLLSALCKSQVVILNPLFSDDTKAMIGCLKTLGIKISVGKDSIKVSGNISSIKNGLYDLNANLSGTTIRFITALSAIVPGIKIIHGKEGLNKRPIGDLVEGLRQLGAKIEYLEKEGFPPIKISSSKLNGGTVKISGSTSSQFISALLMIAPLVGNLEIEIIDEEISKPYIDMTIDIMEKFGVPVSKRENKYTVSNNQYSIKKYTVEGDVSSASYFFAIAALTKSTLTLKNLNPKSVQADMKFLKILEKLGNKISYKKDSITIAGKGSSPVNVDMKDCPDQVQTMAVLAAFAKGKSKISGIGSLRVKETERVKAIEKELKKMGVKTVSTADTIVIEGGNPKPALIETYGDHRMAMAFAVAGAKLEGMEIKDPQVVEKTFPDFWEKLSSIGVGIL